MAGQKLGEESASGEGWHTRLSEASWEFGALPTTVVGHRQILRSAQMTVEGGANEDERMWLDGQRPDPFQR